MKKSKILFGVLAGIIVLICVICFILTRNESSTPQDAATAPVSESPTPTTNSTELIIPENAPQEPIEVDPTDPPIEVKGNVTIKQVDKDPNEVIERIPTIDINHPEVLDVEKTSPMMSPEGSVYRNDKEISIEIVDQQSGEVCTFSFGHITGECNRFLYLNPQFKRNGEPITNNVYYHFDAPYGGGSIQTYGIDVEENREKNLCLNYSFYRALQERQVAGYVDSKHPGTFWFAQQPIENNVYIDVKAYYYQGGLFATLRLTIAKAEDGTYSIVDIDNKDLLTNGENDVYSLSELAHVVELTDETYHTPGAVHAYNSMQLDWKLNVSDCLIELRDAETGLYFNQFIPESGSVWTNDYAQAQMPIIAATYRWKGLPAQTMYFWVLKEPTETTHGTYQYIGYDYPLFQEVSELMAYGYEGNG